MCFIRGNFIAKKYFFTNMRGVQCTSKVCIIYMVLKTCQNIPLLLLCISLKFKHRLGQKTFVKSVFDTDSKQSNVKKRWLTSSGHPSLEKGLRRIEIDIIWSITDIKKQEILPEEVSPRFRMFKNQIQLPTTES